MSGPQLHHRARRYAFTALAATVGVVVTMAMMVASASPASAQISCADQLFGWDVSTADEFNAAVACHNANLAEISNITLLNDIVATTLAGDSVFNEILGGELIIDGGGNTLRRGAGAAATSLPLLTIGSPSEQGDVSVVEVGVDVGAFDTAGIVHIGPTELRLIAVSVYSSTGGSGATGIITGGDGSAGIFSMRLSSIDGVAEGVRLQTDTPAIESSTITSNGVDVTVDGAALGIILNSTLGGPVGIELLRSGIRVENSTILGDGAGVAFETQDDTFVTFESSIVNSCTAPEFLTGTQPGPGFADLGNNVGGCFQNGFPLQLTLADNGCDQATPTGCPLTAALDLGSPAREAGRCDDGTLGALATDQRGEPRTPTGQGCDAGSFEYHVCTGLDIEVGTPGDLTAAIECFNEGAAGPGDYTISLINGIDFTEQSVSAGINQASTGFSLTIDGRSNEFTQGEPAGLPQTPPPPRGLIVIEPQNRALVDITSLNVRVDLRANADYVVWNQSPADLAITDSTFFTVGGTGGSAVASPGGGAVIIDNSFLQSGGTTIELVAGSLTMSNSTVASLRDTVGLGITAEDATALDITNSTIANAVVFTDATVTGSVEHSTLQGGGLGGAGTLSVFSSIVEACAAPVTDNGNNVGGCFDTPVILAPLESTSCVTPAPLSCVPTMAPIGPEALGAGDCTIVTTDQRGEPRTPAGQGCDAGSFEYDVCTGFDIEVGTMDDLSAAIECFNAASADPGDYTISLVNSIDFTEAGTFAGAYVRPISQDRSGFTLTIDGQGNELSQGNPDDLPPFPPQFFGVFVLASENVAPVEIRDLALRIEPSGTAQILIVNVSNADLVIRNSSLSIVRGNVVSTQPGGALVIDNSFLQAGAPSIEFTGSSLTIRNSTILSLAEDFNLGVAAATEIVDIENSTFTNSVVFIGPPASGSDFTGSIRNSTIQGTLSGLGQPEVSSSIIDECDASSIIDGGNNVGACFGTPVTLSPLESTSCVTPAPLTCVPTMAPIAPGALGAGDCGNTPTDQRGKARTPIGPGCDAGAHETPCTMTAFLVDNAEEFNQAIDCVNSGIDVTAHVITLGNDIEVTEIRDGENSLLNAIDQPNAGTVVVVEGNGFAISEVPRGRTRPTNPPPAFSLITMGPDNQATVEFNQVVIETDTIGETPLLILNLSSADLVVRQSLLRGQARGGPSTTIQSLAGGSVSIDESIIRAWGNGVNMDGGLLDVTETTFTSGPSATGIGVALLGPALLNITNSTFDERSILVGGGVSGSVSNTTMRGAGINPGASLDVVSSIIPTCGTALVDGGGNVGDCFGIPVDLAPAVDNGCRRPTPRGCAPTSALSATSPANGAGDCSFVALDQRGVARNPTGPGCDAGSFERTEVGDVNNSGTVDSLDVNALLRWLAGGPAPAALASGDLNDDGEVKLDDALLLAQLIAAGG